MTKVSIWVGNQESTDSLSEFMLEKFTEDGDMYSDFMTAFNIDYIDNQFQEVLFRENVSTKKEFFADFSYVNSYIYDLPEKEWEAYNAIVCVYDFEYNANTKSAGQFDFLGVFEFTEDEEIIL